MSSPVLLKNSWWNLLVDTAKGSSLIEASCESRLVIGVKPSGQGQTPAVVPPGQFLMLPFCNRIDQGTFDIDDHTVTLPMNRPEQSVAIHGFSRDLPWKIVNASDEILELEQEVESGQHPYRYDARLTYRLTEKTFSSHLTVTHRGAQPLPYGLGFHPWFAVSQKATATLIAGTYLDTDTRGLPLPPVPAQPRALTFSRETNLGLDRHYHGWNREATISDPQWAGSVKIRGVGALTNVHVFLSPIWQTMCIEPVSHVPDVQNRRGLARLGDCRMLATGESLSGEMQISWMPDKN